MECCRDASWRTTRVLVGFHTESEALEWRVSQGCRARLKTRSYVGRKLRAAVRFRRTAKATPKFPLGCLTHLRAHALVRIIVVSHSSTARHHSPPTIFGDPTSAAREALARRAWINTVSPTRNLWVCMALPLRDSRCNRTSHPRACVEVVWCSRAPRKTLRQQRFCYILEVHWNVLRTRPKTRG